MEVVLSQVFRVALQISLTKITFLCITSHLECYPPVPSRPLHHFDYAFYGTKRIGKLWFRTIILYSHNLFRQQDEADILGDRIAIMAEGQLRCAGSSLFLKKTYGVGYQLTIEKLKGEKSIAESNHSAKKGEDGSKELMEIVESSVPKAKILTNVGSEISYQVCGNVL